MDERIEKEVRILVERSREVIACSVDGDGFPNAKGMFIRRREGIREFWMSTNAPAIRTAQWAQNPRACLYFMDAKNFYGLMLTGTMQVYMDAQTKKEHWQEGDERYYPMGADDPDYCILRFTAQRGNYYHGAHKQLFDVEIVDEA